MRTVNIDLNKLQDEYFLGFTNEHLITTLNIKLTDDLILGDMFSLKFSVFGTRKIVSDLRAVDGVITYLLPQDITGIINRQCQVLIQITAYLEGVIIGKSAIINGELDDGLEALDPIEPTLITIVDEVHFNTAERHNHTNRATIDLFSTGDNDELLWNDEPIQSEIDLSQYARKDEVIELGDNVSLLNNDAGYLTEADTTAYAMLDDIPTSLSEFDNDVGYITERDMSNFALKTDIPTDVSELNNDAGYLTEHQDLSDYALLVDIPTVPTNVSAFTNDAGYLTQHQDLSSYALKTEIPTVPSNISAFTNDAGYLTEHQDLSDYALLEDIPEVPTNVSAFTNDAGYLTQHQSLANYALKSELPVVPTNISAFTNDSGYLTEADTTDYAMLDDIPTSLSEFDNDVGYLTNSDLSNYALKSELPVVPTNVSAFTNDAGYLTEHQSLAAYALKSELPVIPTNVSAFTNDAGYLTSHQSLAAYALKTDIPTVPTNVSAFTNDAGYLTQHQSLANYALKSEIPTVPTNVSSFTNDAGYLTQHQSLANYALKSEIPVVPTLVSSFTNDAGYLTQHQSLSGYATETYVDEAILEAELGGDIDLSDYVKQEDIQGIEADIIADVYNVVDTYWPILELYTDDFDGTRYASIMNITAYDELAYAPDKGSIYLEGQKLYYDKQTEIEDGIFGITTTTQFHRYPFAYKIINLKTLANSQLEEIIEQASLPYTVEELIDILESFDVAVYPIVFMDDTDVYEDYYVFVFESEIEDQNQIEALGITRVFSQPHNANKIILYVDDDGKLYYRLDTSGDGTLSSDA